MEKLSQAQAIDGAIAAVHQGIQALEANLGRNPKAATSVIQAYRRVTNVWPPKANQDGLAALKPRAKTTLDELGGNLAQSASWHKTQEMETVQDLVAMNPSGMGLDFNTERLIVLGAKSIEMNSKCIIIAGMAPALALMRVLAGDEVEPIAEDLKLGATGFKVALERNYQLNKILAHKVFRLEGVLSFSSTDRRCKEKCFQAFKKADGDKKSIVHTILSSFLEMGRLADTLLKSSV
jgi:hypothetical protein